MACVHMAFIHITLELFFDLYSKDLDEIQDDLKDPSKVVFEPDEDLPGLGQHYCILCCKHCADDATLEVHTKSRFHKKRYV